MEPTVLKRDDRSIGPARAAPAAAVRQPLRWLLLGAGLLLAACSTVQLGYNNADTLLAYWLDSYLDLDEQQQRLARSRIEALLRWHRGTQLTGYAQLLGDAQQRLAGPVSSADVLALNTEINVRLSAIGEQVAPDLAQLALTLQPKQLDRLAEKLAHDTSKARRELLRFAGRQSLEQRLERAIERAENWLGTLSPAQRQGLREAIAQRPDAHESWMQERERRQHDLVAVLSRIRAEQPPPATAAAWVREYFGQLAEPRDPQRRARMQAFRQGNAEMIAQLLNSATPAQRATLLKKLRGYAADFTALAAGGAG